MTNIPPIPDVPTTLPAPGGSLTFQPVTEMSDGLPPMRVIEPASGWELLDVRELWAFRELLYFFVWRDLKVRFKQTALGVVWIVLRPLLSTLVFAGVFGKLARIPSEGLPYSVFVFAALLPWNFFAGALLNASNSLVAHAHLITKTYFPRVLIPVAAILSGVIDLVISVGLALGIMAVYRLRPPLSAAVTVPLLIVVVFAASVGIGLWLGALNVRYRDISALVPFLLQIWMYASPVVYSLDLVPARYRWLALLNPMTGIIVGFRSALFGRPWDLSALALSLGFTVLALLSGLRFFRATERTFADTI